MSSRVQREKGRAMFREEWPDGDSTLHCFHCDTKMSETNCAKVKLTLTHITNMLESYTSATHVFPLLLADYMTLYELCLIALTFHICIKRAGQHRPCPFPLVHTHIIPTVDPPSFNHMRGQISHNYVFKVQCLCARVLQPHPICWNGRADSFVSDVHRRRGQPVFGCYLAAWWSSSQLVLKHFSVLWQFLHTSEVMLLLPPWVISAIRISEFSSRSSNASPAHDTTPTVHHRGASVTWISFHTLTFHFSRG